MNQFLKTSDVGDGSGVDSGQDKCAEGTLGMISYSRMWIICLMGAIPVDGVPN